MPYWIAGSGSWTDVTHWSATSGGVAGTVSPTAADVAVVDGDSGTAPTITFSGTCACLGLNTTAAPASSVLVGASGATLSVGSSGLTIGDNVSVSAATRAAIFESLAPSDRTVATPKGYTAEDLVRMTLGIPGEFTESELAFEQEQELAAEDFIDKRTARPYGVTPVIGEQYILDDTKLLLRYPPVASVEHIYIRETYPGAAWSELVATTFDGDGNPTNEGDYELIYPHTGEVQFGSAIAGSEMDYPSDLIDIGDMIRTGARRLKIDYTPNIPIPGNITRAATMFVAWSLYSHFKPERCGVVSAQLTTGVALTYVPELMCNIPQGILDLIDYRMPIWA